jgi:hypothetical protein
MDSDYAIGTVEFHPQLSKPEYRKNCLTGRQRDNLTRKRPGHACVRADAPSRRMPNSQFRRPNCFCQANGNAVTLAHRTAELIGWEQKSDSTRASCRKFKPRKVIGLQELFVVDRSVMATPAPLHFLVEKRTPIKMQPSLPASKHVTNRRSEHVHQNNTSSTRCVADHVFPPGDSLRPQQLPGCRRLPLQTDNQALQSAGTVWCFRFDRVSGG